MISHVNHCKLVAHNSGSMKVVIVAEDPREPSCVLQIFKKPKDPKGIQRTPEGLAVVSCCFYWCRF